MTKSNKLGYFLYTANKSDLSLYMIVAWCVISGKEDCVTFDSIKPKKAIIKFHLFHFMQRLNQGI